MSESVWPSFLWAVDTIHRSSPPFHTPPGAVDGVRCIVGAQNVGQVSAGYGADGAADSILAGFGTVVAFRLFDAESRDFVRQRHGRNRRRLAVPSVIGARGVLEEVVEGSVIEDWDLSGLEVGQAVVSPPSGPPQRWQLLPYAASS